MEFVNIPILKEFYFRLSRNDLDKIKIIMPTPSIEYHPSKYSNNLDKWKNDINLFKEVISKNINRKYLSNFYRNLNSLIITNDDIKKEKKQVLEVKGCYTFFENKITLSQKSKKDTIFHELFHVATTTYKNNNLYSGFNQCFFYKGKWVNIAEGINEGYTQVLTERYFPSKKENRSSYPFEKEVMLHIENIIGRKELEELYFTNYLNWLINELKQSTDNENDIDEIILKTDYINRNLYNKMSIKELITTQKYINDVSLLLIKLKVNKLINEVYYDDKDENEFNNELISYIKSLSKSIKVKHNKFYFLNLKQTEEYLKDVLENKEIKIKKK